MRPTVAVTCPQSAKADAPKAQQCPQNTDVSNSPVPSLRMWVAYSGAPRRQTLPWGLRYRLQPHGKSGGPAYLLHRRRHHPSIEIGSRAPLLRHEAHYRTQYFAQALRRSEAAYHFDALTRGVPRKPAHGGLPSRMGDPRPYPTTDTDGGKKKKDRIDRRTTVLKVEGFNSDVTEDAIKEHFECCTSVNIETKDEISQPTVNGIPSKYPR